MSVLILLTLVCTLFHPTIPTYSCNFLVAFILVFRVSNQYNIYRYTLDKAAFGAVAFGLVALGFAHAHCVQPASMRIILGIACMYHACACMLQPARGNTSSAL